MNNVNCLCLAGHPDRVPNYLVLLLLWNNIRADMTNTIILRNPVRYCPMLVVSPGLKMSWKNMKSTNRNPKIKTMYINLLITVLYQFLVLLHIRTNLQITTPIGLVQLSHYSGH